MTGADVPSVIFYALMLLLPLSALTARRLGWRQNAKMALGWVAIFAVIILLMAERERFAVIGSDLRRAFDPEAGQQSGAALRIPMAEDGHFWVRAEVNGVAVRFLIDSGATTIALGTEAARAAGVRPGSGLVSGIEIPLNTANGTVMARRATIARLKLGTIERSDIGALVAGSFGETNVLGMNFLSSLASWRVEGRTLILQP